MHKQHIFQHIPPIILVTVALIAGIYFLMAYDPDMERLLTQMLALSSDVQPLQEPYLLITYGLLHADLAHMALNMLWLLIFGTPIARYFSSAAFLSIFLAGLIAGGIAHFFVIQDTHSVLVGASAGVTALCGAALRFMLKTEFDFREIPLLLRFFDTRYLVIFAVFVIIDLINAFIQTTLYNNNIAWYAHIAGLFVGAMMMSISLINRRALLRDSR
ncbi:MAG: rhomboid family intramembrane serine protease [Pseudomonadota bacterium]